MYLFINQTDDGGTMTDLMNPKLAQDLGNKA